MTIDEAINHIRELPVSEIIGNYISLESRGTTTKALCPFHNDSNPSMVVNDDKKLFKCFVCGAGGDSISFVQRFLGIDFVDVIKDIGQKIGVDVQDKKSKPIDKKEVYASKILKAVTKIYIKHSQRPDIPFFKNFLQNRNISEDTALNFQIGYAPNTSSIYNYLKTIPQEEFEFALNVSKELGVIKETNGNHFDTFRNRIVFPIWDEYSKIVGFSSRAATDQVKPKYLNSKESFFFHKRKVLYGLNFAKNYIRQKKRLIIVEGQMDCITMHQNDFQETIAISGIALDKDMAKKLIHLTKNIFIAVDNDQAGEIAMKKINDLFLSFDVIPKSIDLGKYKDPDEFLNSESHMSFSQKISDAKSCLDQIIDKVIHSTEAKTIDQKIQVFDEACKIVSPLGNHLYAREKLIDTGKKIGLKSSPEDLILRYQDFLGSTSKPNSVQKIKVLESSDHNGSKNQENQGTKRVETQEKQLLKSYRALLQYLVQNPEATTLDELSEILANVRNNEVLGFVSELKKLYFEIDITEYSGLLTTLISKDNFSLEIKEVVGSSLFDYKMKKFDKGKFIKFKNDLNKQLQTDHLIIERDELKKSFQNSKNENDINSYLEKINQINKQLNQLKQTF